METQITNMDSFLADQARIGSYLLDCRRFGELQSLNDELNSTNTSTRTSTSTRGGGGGGEMIDIPFVKIGRSISLVSLTVSEGQSKSTTSVTTITPQQARNIADSLRESADEIEKKAVYDDVDYLHVISERD